VYILIFKINDATAATYYKMSIKPRLHQIHVAGHKYPGRATLYPYPSTCHRKHVEGYHF